RRPGAVLDRARHDEALAGIERDGAVGEVDEQLAAHDEEELVVVVVVVPVVLTLDNAHADDGVVDPAQRLVEPLVSARVGERAYMERFERAMKDVEPGYVRVRRLRGRGLGHDG